jgi:hypothetical protein
VIITRDVEETITVVDWTDDCRVLLSQRKARMKYTLTEARALRSHLDTAIREASVAAEGLVHVSVPLPTDVDVPTGVCSSRSNGYLCTLAPGHEGVHVAQSSDPVKTPYAAWGGAA